MRGIASAQESPGARTCVVLGGLDQVQELDLRPYRFVLWWGRRGAAAPARLGVAAGSLAFDAIEDLTEFARAYFWIGSSK